jgi:hypothetical protein
MRTGWPAHDRADHVVENARTTRRGASFNPAFVIIHATRHAGHLLIPVSAISTVLERIKGLLQCGSTGTGAPRFTEGKFKHAAQLISTGLHVKEIPRPQRVILSAPGVP